MLHTVSEISESLGLSKQTVYVKMRVKGFKVHMTKKQGVTYIDEVGFNLIKDSLKATTDDLKDFKDKDTNTTYNSETATDKLDNSVELDYINMLKAELKVKNEQIYKLHELLQNSQILLKSKSEEVKLLEEPVKAKVSFFTKLFK